MIDLFNSRKVKLLAGQILHMQNHIDNIQQAQEKVLSDPLKYSWNRFTDYDAYIEAIHSMYNMEEPWGCSIGALVDLRAAFVGGSGIEINEIKPESSREQAYALEFLKYNKLSGAGFLSYLQSVEKEGKSLFIFSKDDDYSWAWKDGDREIQEKGMIRAQYVSYEQKKYKIIPDPNNPDIAETLIIKNSSGQDVPIKKENFSYRRLRGKAGKINTAVPVFWRIIENVISLEKAYSDRRTNNHLFSAPKPIVECKTADEARETESMLNAGGKGYNMASRRFLIITGSSKYLIPEEKADLEKEIAGHRFGIAMVTGIPVHLLGDPTALKNKNVNEGALQGTRHSTQLDREMEQDIFSEMINKAMMLQNGVLTALDPSAVEAKITEITAADWQQLIDFFFPACEAGKISTQTFHEKIPGLNPEIEKARLEEEEKKNKENESPTIFDQIIEPVRAEQREEENEG